MITPITSFKPQVYNNIFQFPQKKAVPAHSIVEQPLRTPILSPIYFTSNITRPKKCYIIGHKNPDTDSVVSAIAYAYLQDQLGRRGCIPIAAGELKAETKYALDYVGAPYPKIITDFDTKVAEITTTPSNKKSILNENSTVKDFGDMVLNKNIKSAPVINSGTKELLGMVSEKDLAKAFLSSYEVSDSEMNFKAIRRTLGAKVLAGENILNQNFEGRFIIGDSLEQTTIDSLQKNDLLIVGDRERVQEEAIKKGVKCIIVTGNRAVSDDVVALARKNNVIIFSSSLDTYSTTKLVDQSKPTTSIMTADSATIDGKTKLSDIRKNDRDYTHRTYPVMKDDIYIGTVDKVDILNPPEREFILVDHNDPKQIADGIKNEEIVDILDHHKPIFVSNREDRIDVATKKCGSTSTLVAREFKANSVRIPKHIETLLLCGILSDTDNLTSDSTEPVDRQMVKELAKSLNISNVESFGAKLLASRQEELDTKQYEMTDKDEVAISQIFTQDPKSYMERHKDIYESLNEYDNEHQTAGYVVMLTDLRNKSSYIFASDKFKQKAHAYLSSASKSKLNQKAVNHSTMKEAIVKICDCNSKKMPALFSETSSRKEQVEPFVRRIYTPS